MNRLIERFLILKNNYRNYDTKHALKRMQAFRQAVRELCNKGYPVAIELLGSISFGIAEPCSDADCVLLHYCDLHQEDGECPVHCPNLIFEQEEIVKTLKKKLPGEMFHIEFLDWVNLKYIENLVKRGQTRDNEIVYRLLYYRTMGRPVNRPLVVKYCEILEQDQELMRGFSEWSSAALAAYLETPTHRYSFNKYNERIINLGVSLPPELKEELIKYIEDIQL